MSQRADDGAATDRDDGLESALAQSALNVTQPSAGRVSAAPPTERHPVHVLRIDPDGSARLDGTPRSDEQLLQELQAIRTRDAKSTVVVQGDPKARFARVVAMIDLCNEAQVGLSLATARIGF